LILADGLKARRCPGTAREQDLPRSQAPRHWSRGNEASPIPRSVLQTYWYTAERRAKPSDTSFSHFCFLWGFWH